MRSPGWRSGSTSPMRCRAPREILGAPEQVRDRGIAVAAGATGLLVIGLDRFRQAGMRDEADVRLVDAHPERDRRADDHVLRCHEIGLVPRADLWFQTGVIGAGRPAAAAQRLGELLGRGAGLGIDDTRAGLVGDQVGDLLGGVGARADQVADVGTIEPGHDHALRRDAELLADVRPRMRIGGRGQREPADIGKCIHQRFEQTIVGAEIVAPFADAMRLVDRKQADRRAAQQFAKVPRRSALGGDVEQVELAGLEARDRLAPVLVGAGQRAGANPDRLGRAQLVVHQRDQRRDDDARSFEHHGGQLVAERLARAGRHHRQRPFPRQHARDDIGLDAAERGKAEDALQCGEGIEDHGHAVIASSPSRDERALMQHVRDNRAEQEFELTVDGHRALAAYQREGDTIVFTHTAVPPEIEGHGIASKLVRFALDSARDQGLKVVAQCAFVRAYIERHPEYRDLVA